MKIVTVAYEVVDEAKFDATNPLHYEHDGLKAFHVGIGDALEDREAFRDELERLIDVVSEENQQSIQGILNSANVRRDFAVDGAPEVPKIGDKT